MSSISVRRFARSDREQVTALVNAHIGAVLPNVSVSVQGLLSQLEREPGEFVVDPWVAERMALVAEQRGRIVAAALLLRYRRDEDVAERYRGAGEIRWLVCWPEAPYWPDAAEAGDLLAAACLAQFARWNANPRYADGALPAPGVYGVPEQWPHVAAIYRRAGFRAEGRTEVVLVADVADLLRSGPPPLPGLAPIRTVGGNGTRISAVRDEAVLGFVEVDTNLDTGTRMTRLGGWADVGELWVAESHRRQGIGGWLLGQAAAWLRLGEVTRLLDYADADQADYLAFLAATGFSTVTRTVRELVG
ncbi:GNAT family N-acetyltransferase [Micromonosporaceae bacterium B7E4]